MAVCVGQVPLAGLNGLAPGRAHNFPAQIASPTKNRNSQFLGREGSKAEVDAGFSEFLPILDPVLPCLPTIGWPLLINCGSKTTAAGSPAVNV